MSREVIIRLIEEERDEEIARLRKKAEEESAGIREKGRLRADQKAEQIRRETEREIEAMRRAILLQAEFEAMAAERKARWDGIEEVFSIAEEELSEIVSSSAYPGILRHLILEGREMISDGALTILCRAEDREAAEEAAEGISNVTVTPLSGHDPMIRIGGVILLARDGAIRCDQTFPTRLLNMRNKLTQTVSGVLYGGGDTGY
ncbi:hypothetical protein RJ53_04100 [Methanocalculus chunghsingensis]|uniref:A-type ATP synthase subunit E n=1 Tax=Methanocalculus chunghsingensis TaxID=156457 RepID=A0A8J7W5J6_9EURY|nr:V-type ATP synthase subunit E family protein [Methanocalculus chunghsingensis]MBR1368734.1 hypothetical protein [Methanocalculus chunghsingensis]